MPRTDQENRLRRAWASKLARQEAAEPLARALNSLYIRSHEKREVQALLEREPWQGPAELARVQQLIADRQADPDSLENWGSRQLFNRAYSATTPDVAEPSRFNTRREYTTR